MNEVHVTSEITMGAIINWVVVIGVGAVIIGLVKYIFKKEKDSFLTKESHHEICDGRTKYLEASFKKSLESQTAILEKSFDLLVENKILKTMRELNGKT